MCQLGVPIGPRMLQTNMTMRYQLGIAWGPMYVHTQRGGSYEGSARYRADRRASTASGGLSRGSKG